MCKQKNIYPKNIELEVPYRIELNNNISIKNLIALSIFYFENNLWTIIK